MIPRVLASIANGAQAQPGQLTPGDPPPHGLGRCDRCGAEALVLLERDAETLAFCGHHATTYIDALAATGWSVEEDGRPDLAVAEG
jgi:hypothetical protein